MDVHKGYQPQFNSSERSVQSKSPSHAYSQGMQSPFWQVASVLEQAPGGRVGREVGGTSGIINRKM